MLKILSFLCGKTHTPDEFACNSDTNDHISVFVNIGESSFATICRVANV